VALIVTGGIAPAPSGVTMAGGAVLNDASHLAHHRHITDAVHQEGGKIALQILHTGRYSYQPRWWRRRHCRRRLTALRRMN
jgi:2,4-dienoyl-CoA reductase (NADPH2)